MSAVRKYLERKYSRAPDVDSEMTDGDSSELTFHEVGSAENDGQLRSPKTIPVENMILEDFFVDIAHTAKNKGSPKSIPMESMILDDFLVDIAHTAKINKVKPNDSDKDMSGSSISALTQDCNIKGSVAQAFIEAESNVLYQEKPSLKKPVAQANVSFQKGYSQMDWLKLRHTQPDLSGLEGQSRSISLKEVKQHKSGESIWIILKGGVYNIAPYMKFHPGGVDMLMKTAGKDCTALFNQYHPWVNAKFLLEKCYIGSLAPHECMYTIKDTMAPNLEARHSSPILASPLPWRLGGPRRRHNQGGCPSGRRRRPVRRAIQS